MEEDAQKLRLQIFDPSLACCSGTAHDQHTHTHTHQEQSKPMPVTVRETGINNIWIRTHPAQIGEEREREGGSRERRGRSFPVSSAMNNRFLNFEKLCVIINLIWRRRSSDRGWRCAPVQVMLTSSETSMAVCVCACWKVKMNYNRIFINHSARVRPKDGCVPLGRITWDANGGSCLLHQPASDGGPVLAGCMGEAVCLNLVMSLYLIW